jgi:hypothetical protein
MFNSIQPTKNKEARAGLCGIGNKQEFKARAGLCGIGPLKIPATTTEEKQGR